MSFIALNTFSDILIFMTKDSFDIADKNIFSINWSHGLHNSEIQLQMYKSLKNNRLFLIETIFACF